ncbi:MAG TPA: hypothetical protein VK985_01900 [Rariglobus sp.]|nr:hypothetical protein [Rariglobus sp.]
MSTHEAVQYILKNLPPDVSLHDVAKEIEVIAAIREGIESAEREPGYSVEDLKQEIPKWVAED